MIASTQRNIVLKQKCVSCKNIGSKCSQRYRNNESSLSYAACFTCSGTRLMTAHKDPCENALYCLICKVAYVQCKNCNKKLDCIPLTLFQPTCQSDPYVICSECWQSYQTTDDVIGSCRSESGNFTTKCDICASFVVCKLKKVMCPLVEFMKNARLLCFPTVS